MTGRQRPMTEVRLLAVEVRTADGLSGLGISYSKRAGGAGQYAHALEIGDVVIGEDPSDIGKIYDKLAWAGAFVGRGGLATQAWLEHFEWLEPVFNERLKIDAGRIVVPTAPGLGLTLSERAGAWTTASAQLALKP